MDGGFFTLVLTFFLIIFYPLIVDSEFCCMFTPSQRSETKNTTIMKTIIYTESIPNWEIFLQKKSELNSLPKSKNKWNEKIYLKSSYLTDAIEEFIKANK